MKLTIRGAVCLLLIMGSNMSILAKTTNEISPSTRAKHAGLGLAKALGAGAELTCTATLLFMGYIVSKRQNAFENRFQIAQADADAIQKLEDRRLAISLLRAFTLVAVPTFLVAAYKLAKSSIASFKQAAAKSPEEAQQEPKIVD